MTPRATAPRGVRLRRSLLLLGFLAAVLWHPAREHLRAASLLARLADPQAAGALARLSSRPVEEREEVLPGTRARLYLPTGVAHPPGLVLSHGVHWKGIDEPRLVRFARTLSASGVAVFTPELRELCDYRIDPASVDTIGAAAAALSARLGGGRVGLAGVSFAAGLSLVAASDPRYRGPVSMVLAVGGHDDLGRVLRFFVTDVAPRPDAPPSHIHAHDYGTVVLEYGYAEDLFPPDDLPAARDTLRLVLREQLDAAHERSLALSPVAAERMRHILAHDTAALAPDLLAEIGRLEARFAAVSPSAHLDGLRAPVFVLHGAGDVVIPPTEAEWLAHDVPKSLLRGALVSAAIEHVDLGGKPGLGEQLALVHLLAEVLGALDEGR